MFIDLTYRRDTILSGIAGSLRVEGYGTVKIGNSKIYNVAYSPEVPFNLLSISQSTITTEKSYVFTRYSVSWIEPDGTTRKLGTAKKGLYILDTEENFPSTELSSLNLNHVLHSLGQETNYLPDGNKPHVKTTSLLYNRLGCPGTKLYNKLAPIICAPPLKIPHHVMCPTCTGPTIDGKFISTGPTKNISRPLQLLEVYCMGESTFSNSNSQGYYMFIRDVYSMFTHVIYLDDLSTAIRHLSDWICYLERCHTTSSHHYKVKAVRTPDLNGFNNSALHSYLKSKKIEHQLHINYGQLPGLDNWYFTKVQEMASAMLHRARAPSFFLKDAISCAVFTLNRLPIAGKDSAIPFCLFNGLKRSEFSLHNLRIFGCAAVAKPPDHYMKTRSAAVATSSDTITGAFVGYVPEIRGYKIYDYLTGKTFVSKEVYFDERIYPLGTITMDPSTNTDSTPYLKDSSDVPHIHPDPNIESTVYDFNHFDSNERESLTEDLTKDIPIFEDSPTTTDTQTTGLSSDISPTLRVGCPNNSIQENVTTLDTHITSPLESIPPVTTLNVGSVTSVRDDFHDSPVEFTSNETPPVPYYGGDEFTPPTYNTRMNSNGLSVTKSVSAVSQDTHVSTIQDSASLDTTTSSTSTATNKSNNDRGLSINVSTTSEKDRSSRQTPVPDSPYEVPEPITKPPDVPYPVSTSSQEESDLDSNISVLHDIDEVILDVDDSSSYTSASPLPPGVLPSTTSNYQRASSDKATDDTDHSDASSYTSTTASISPSSITSQTDKTDVHKSGPNLQSSSTHADSIINQTFVHPMGDYLSSKEHPISDLNLIPIYIPVPVFFKVSITDSSEPNVPPDTNTTETESTSFHTSPDIYDTSDLHFSEYEDVEW